LCSDVLPGTWAFNEAVYNCLESSCKTAKALADVQDPSEVQLKKLTTMVEMVAKAVKVMKGHEQYNGPHCKAMKILGE
jgi:hypothetical protein